MRRAHLRGSSNTTITPTATGRYRMPQETRSLILICNSAEAKKLQIWQQVSQFPRGKGQHHETPFFHIFPTTSRSQYWRLAIKLDCPKVQTSVEARHKAGPNWPRPVEDPA